VTINAKGAYSVAVGDFNGDGHLDLASASVGDNKIAWYKNTDGQGTFGPQIVVTAAAKYAWSVAVGDFNGDGHLDLASASSSAVAWYKNMGNCCPPGSSTPDGAKCSKVVKEVQVLNGGELFLIIVAGFIVCVVCGVLVRLRFFDKRANRGSSGGATNTGW
jgi:hypothetical protein